MSMKLIVAIVHRDDGDRLMEALIRAGYRATRLSSTGGFLREGSTTLLIGIDEERVPMVLDVIKGNTTSHTQRTPSFLGIRRSRPGEVIFAAANVFVLDLPVFMRL